MADPMVLQQYGRLIQGATKDHLAECARLFALNHAHYQGKYSELPLDETLAMVNAVEPNEEQAILLRDGMEIPVGASWCPGVLGGLDEKKHQALRKFALITGHSTVGD